MKKFWLSIPAAALFVAAIFYWQSLSCSYVHLDAGYVEAPFLRISANEPGTILELLVKEGDVVELGSPLFSIENPQVLERQTKAQIAFLDLRKELQVYKSQSEQAMQNYLSDLGVRSEREVDQHLQAMQEAQMKAAQTEGQLQAAQEELRLLQAQNGKSTLRARCKAAIVREEKTAGDQVAAGEPILTLFDISEPWIETEVPEKHLHLLKIGQKASIYLTAYPGKSWDGLVSWIGPATVSKMKGASFGPDGERIGVKISIAEKDFPVKPGLSAKVSIRVK